VQQVKFILDNQITILMKAVWFCAFTFFIRAAYGQNVDSSVAFPGARGGSFIYHPESKAMLLIGNEPIPDTIRKDVWKWDGKKWSRIEASGPGWTDFSQGTTLNRNTGTIVSFAGYDMFDDPKTDTWIFNGHNWKKTITNDIGNRIHHAMVFADHLNAFVMYGGFDEDRNNDTLTWLLKDGKFTAMNIPGPGVRHLFSMAYDRNRKKVILYGGSDRSSEHWEFDGRQWTKIGNMDLPGSRQRHTMFYDDSRKMVILHGGDPRGSTTETTWGWNGKNWEKIVEDKIETSAIGYDENRKVIVAYGHDENSNWGVWELQGNHWDKIADYGKWDMNDYRKRWTQQHPDRVMLLIGSSFGNLFSGNFSEAETGYRKVEKIFPHRKSMLVNLTYALLMQDKWNEADVYMQKINDLGPLERRLSVRLADYLVRAKQFEKAAIYYEKSLKIKPAGNYYFNLACCYANINNKDKAFDNLNKAIAYSFDSKKVFETNKSLLNLKEDKRWEALAKGLK
jgi:hypothetical protein